MIANTVDIPAVVDMAYLANATNPAMRYLYCGEPVSVPAFIALCF